MKRIVFLIFGLVIFTWIANGQNTLAEAGDLTGPEPCGDRRFAKSATLTGTVMKRNFADDEVTMIGFVLRDRRDQRWYININAEFLESQSGSFHGSLSHVLSLGNYIKATTDECGKTYTLRRVKKLKR